MGLVEYPESSSASSASEDDENGYANAPGTKRARLKADQKRDGNEVELPSLPPAFHDLYSATARASTSDDPSLHGGRKRLVPHVAGNWSAHVYLEWHPSSAALALLTTLLTHIPHGRGTKEAPPLHSLLTSPTSAPLPLHVSLSAPLILDTPAKTRVRTALVTALRETVAGVGVGGVGSVAAAVRRTGAGSLTLRPTRGGLRWHANGRGTRRFLVLGVEEDAGEGGALAGLLGAVNGVVRREGLEELYADDRKHQQEEEEEEGGPRRWKGAGFHISVAWSLGEDEGEVDAERLGEEGRAVLGSVQGLKIEFTDVKVKVGKEVTSIPFKEPRKAAPGGGWLR